MKILVVDDNPALGRALGRALRGHDVAIEDDADRALDRLDKGEWFDLVLCDMNMPKRLGTEVMHAIRSMYGADDAPTLVLMSGSEQKAQGSGADVFILKPFQSSELQSLLALALEMSEQRRTAETRRIPIRHAVGC